MAKTMNPVTIFLVHPHGIETLALKIILGRVEQEAPTSKPSTGVKSLST